MGIVELFILAVGLSMDAFAVSICKGLSLQKINLKSVATVGIWFGLFQALMPLIGYFVGVNFTEYIVEIDHWIAFGLLTMIGINMLREAFSDEDEEDMESASSTEDHLHFKKMFVLAVATSIDALAMGVTFAFLKVNIVYAVSFIGIVTFTLSMIGVKLGSIFGTKYKSKAEIAGGVILILLGTKILVEHLGLI